ncbi:protein of unknown function [Methylocaldum szegediense]|uniref:Uncharacterized protein n=1 Tax=Methylocaldum szegediense TaxID=73780 RepID=A0ABN8X4P6_9GAMM|nr:protein of unknown function [Methylocaldum szegediense]
MKSLLEKASAAIGFHYTDEHIDTASQLSGEPAWIRGNATPRCRCRKAMTFYGQFDSVDDEVDLADYLMIYVFVCFGCYETTKSVLQPRWPSITSRLTDRAETRVPG